MYENGSEGDDAPDDGANDSGPIKQRTFRQDGERGEDDRNLEKDFTEVEAKRLVSAKCTFILEIRRFFRGFFHVLAIAFRLAAIVFRALGRVGHGHRFEEVSSDFGLITPNRFGLIACPLIGRFLLEQKLLIGKQMAEHRHDRKRGGDDGHGAGNPLVEGVVGMFSVLFQFFAWFHRVELFYLQSMTAERKAYRRPQWPPMR